MRADSLVGRDLTHERGSHESEQQSRERIGNGGRGRTLSRLRQWAISELSAASISSISKRVQVQNLSYENEFDLHLNELVSKPDLHMKGFTRGLVLKQRQRELGNGLSLLRRRRLCVRPQKRVCLQANEMQSLLTNTPSRTSLRFFFISVTRAKRARTAAIPDANTMTSL